MNIPAKDCSSCGACANICSHNAISMQLDNEGFYRPKIDKNKCVQCGVCEKTCPWTNAVANPYSASNIPKTLAAFAKNESVRLKSSSGGIFTVLAEKILDCGGVVAGVAQITPIRFAHIIVDNKTDLNKLRGSKYVQADAGFVYREIRAHLKSGKTVLFSGTPCQVAGLYAVLGKTFYANLITLDIVCHGTPSVKVFEKYVKEIEKETSSHLSSTFFRDKRKGWRLFSMTMSLKTKSGNYFQKSKTLDKDVFMQLFLKNICLNTSCTNCKYGKIPRIADITLGDYWNIADTHPKMDDNNGISLVLLNTDHGKTLFNSASNDITQIESKINFAVAGNPCLIKSSPVHPNRENFFKSLDQNSLNQLAKKYKIKQPFYKTFFSSIIIILWNLYQKISGKTIP